MIAPQARLAAPSALPPTFLVRDGRLGVSRTGTPAGCHALDVLGHALSLCGLGGGVGTGCLLRSLAGGHDEKTERFDRELSISVFHCHGANDTRPVPVSRWLLPRTARWFEPEGHRTVLLAPRFPLVPHGPGARDQCDKPNTLCEASSEGAFTVGWTSRHTAAYPVESQRPTLCNGPGGLCAVTRMAIAHPHTEWEPSTPHPAAQKPLLELIMAILAGPIRRPRRDQSCDGAGCLLISPLQGDRCRILMEPGCRAGLHLQGVERDRPKHAIALRGNQGIEALPQPISMERGSRAAGLEQGAHPTFLQACPSLREGLMASQNRQEQRRHATATRKDRSGVWRAEGIAEGRPVELADYPQHPRHVGHRTERLHGKRHEASRPQGLLEVAS
jgi:hypothetical protein